MLSPFETEAFLFFSYYDPLLQLKFGPLSKIYGVTCKGENILTLGHSSKDFDIWRLLYYVSNLPLSYK